MRLAIGPAAGCWRPSVSISCVRCASCADRLRDRRRTPRPPTSSAAPRFVGSRSNKCGGPTRERTAWRRPELPISTANSQCSELPLWQRRRRRTRRTPAGSHDSTSKVWFTPLYGCRAKWKAASLLLPSHSIRLGSRPCKIQIAAGLVLVHRDRQH